MNYITIDIETNGANPETDDILLLSAVKITDGKITDTFSRLVKPSRPQSDEMALFTGITNEDLTDADELSLVIKEFSDFSRDCVIVSYDNFEYFFLNSKGFVAENIIYLREYLKNNYTNIEKFIADAVIISLGLEKHLKEEINRPAFYNKTRLFYALKVAIIFMFVLKNDFEI